MSETAESLSFSLHHLSGAKKGRRELFAGNRISIGRGRNNHCSFDAEEDRTVSARHAEIRLEGTAAYIYDTGSLNGTYLNGKRVRRALLGDGDEIGLGREGPRLRFMLHSGQTADPIQPGDQIPITEFRSRGTTQEEMLADGSSLQGSLPLENRRTPAPAIIVAGVVLLMAAVSVMVFLHREGGGPGDGGSETGSGGDLEIVTPREVGAGTVEGDALPALPEGVDAAAVLILGRLQSADQRIVHRELGAGVFVGPGLVATVGPVLDAAEAFLAGGADAGGDLEIRVAPAGIAPRAVAVRGYHASDPSDLPRLVLLVLETADAAPARRLLSGTPRRGELRLLEPGVGQRKVRVGEFLDRAHEPTREPDEAWLLRVSGLPPYGAGQPLVNAGQGADLIALSIGPQAPGLAVSARAYASLIESARKNPPTPIP